MKRSVLWSMRQFGWLTVAFRGDSAFVLPWPRNRRKIFFFYRQHLVYAYLIKVHFVFIVIARFIHYMPKFHGIHLDISPTGTRSNPRQSPERNLFFPFHLAKIDHLPCLLRHRDYNESKHNRDFYCWSQILHSKIHWRTRNRRNIWIVLQPSSQSFGKPFSPIFTLLRIYAEASRITLVSLLFPFYSPRFNLPFNSRRASLDFETAAIGVTEKEQFQKCVI